MISFVIWTIFRGILLKSQSVVQNKIHFTTKNQSIPCEQISNPDKTFCMGFLGVRPKENLYVLFLVPKQQIFFMSPGKPKRSYFREILVDEDLLLLTGLFYPNFPAYPFVKMHLIILENVFQFFLAFFLAMYVEVKARHTVYQLICKFFYLNHEW